MEFGIVDYSSLTENEIRLRREEWNRVLELSGGKRRTDENARRVLWESIVWPEGFPDCLKDLPLEEQIGHYVVKEESEYSRSSYGEVDKARLTSGGFIPLVAYKRFRAAIVKDGVIVGAVVSDYYGRRKYLYPSRPQCLYWSVDSDGSGSSSSDVYVRMCCLPVEKE